MKREEVPPEVFHRPCRIVLGGMAWYGRPVSFLDERNMLVEDYCSEGQVVAFHDAASFSVPLITEIKPLPDPSRVGVLELRLGVEYSDFTRDIVQKGLGEELGSRGWRLARWVERFRQKDRHNYALPVTLKTVEWILFLRQRILNRRPGSFQRWADSVFHNHCTNLLGGLYLPLGSIPPAEEAFVRSIFKDSADRASWSAYSDWLQEQDDQTTRVRGEQIASWLINRQDIRRWEMP